MLYTTKMGTVRKTDILRWNLNLMFSDVVCTGTGAGPTLGTIFGRSGNAEVSNG